MPPKRKRPERSSGEGGRPSPHRPGDTGFGQRDRDFDGGGRGGRGGRNTRRNDRRDSTQSQAGQGAGSSSNSQRPTSPTMTRPQNSASQAPHPSPTAIKPPQAPASAAPSPVPSTYCYDNLTDEKITSWKDGGRQGLIEHGVQSRDDVDITELSSLFQEFIHSAVEGRLSPADAGACVKVILGPETQEMIKDSFSFEPHTLFLDTLSIVMDNEPNLYQPQLREFLIATEVSPMLMRQVLDAPLLQQLGLIRDNFVKLGIRQSTNLLYRQANYNLLREETEGYSKLTTELFTTSSSEPPSAEAVQATFERIKGLIGTFDLDVGRVLDVTLDVFAAVLIKQFRFFIKLLRVSSWWPRSQLSPSSVMFAGGLPNWALPESSHWMPSEEDELAVAELARQRDVQFWDRAREVHIDAFFELSGRKITDAEQQHLALADIASDAEADAEHQWMKITKTLPPPGNRVAAQLLGFKLRFYTSEARDPDDVLPANLLYLAALLIKVGFLSLVDLYPHLWPLDEGMETLREKRMKELEEKERLSRPGAASNALLMAGALPDDTVPASLPSRGRDAVAKSDAESKANGVAAEEKEKLPEPMEQKATLLLCLLTIGAIPEALFILGRFPWLPEAFPEILDRVHRILNHSIEKVYQESRPVAIFPAECPPTQIADIDQTGAPKGTVKLGRLPPKRSLRWPFPDKSDLNEGQHYRFYWDEWADNVPICQTVDDVFTLCGTLLNISGVNIGKDETLLAKLISIGAKSLSEDQSKHNFDRWQDLLRRLLVPALSLTKANASIVNSIWDLLKLYPSPTRYAIYAEWYEGQISRLPAMKAAFARTRLETLGTMKRISLTNLSDMAKSLAKTSYSSPGIVFKVALDQIESYANLIEAFVECAKYFTDLSYDVLVWSLMSSLGGKQRSRTQESSVLLTSKWLQALSRFSGKVFKRYSVLNPTPVIQYVNDQLFRGNSTDLIILKELISSMGGVVQTLDFTEDQVLAMSGGEILRRQTLLSVQDKRFDSKRSAKRLMQSLTDFKLAGQLLVNVAQYRQSAIYKIPDDEAHIKYLATMIDDSHQMLVQYLDLLRSNLEPHEFDELVPTTSQLIDEFGLDASLAFLIGRDSLAFYMFPRPSDKHHISSQGAADSDGDVSMAEDKISQPTTITAVVDEASPESETANGLPTKILDVVQPIVDSIQSTASSTVWEKITPEFCVTFWALQLGDFVVPISSYNKAQKHVSNLRTEVMKDRSDMTRTGMNKKEAKKAEYQKIMNDLLAEIAVQQERVARNKFYITKRMKSWFTGSFLKLNGISDAIIEQCLFPRLVLSASDAEYCYAITRSLHDWVAPNFKLMSLYDRLFNVNRLRSMIFTCTVREAEHLGRFLNCVLKDLSKWHRDINAYNREAIKSKTLGFATAVDEAGQPTSYLEHAQFRDVLYGWHKNLNIALKSCLGGMEWMHIRNAITILKAVLDFFPAVEFMGRQFMELLKTITDRESASKSADADEAGHRVDLSVAAQGALSELQRRKTKWVLPAGFRPNTTGQSHAKSKDGDAANAESTGLRATAPDFKPGSAKPTSAEDEDGEVKDGKDGKGQTATAPTPPTSHPQKEPNLPPKPSVPHRDTAKSAASTSNLPRPDIMSTPSSKPSTPRLAAALPGTTSSGQRELPRSVSGPDRSTPNLPKRPDVPFPSHYPQERFNPAGAPDRRDPREPRDVRGPRDIRETRDSREVRDHRDPRDLRDARDLRLPEPPRQERARDFPNSDRRPPPENVSREPGRLSEKDWSPRQETLPSRRGDRTASERDSRPARDRPPPVNGRGHDSGRLSREPTTATTAAPAPAQPMAEEPPINPERAALFQQESLEQPPRLQDPDRRARGPRLPEIDRPDITNPQRAALITGTRDPPPRMARDEGLDRPPSRTDSPRRNGRFNQEPIADASRDEKHIRSHHSDHRSSTRDSHDDSSQMPPTRGDRSIDRDNDRFMADKGRDGSAFHPTQSSHAPENDHGRPAHQDHNYGRLNPIQSVVADIPSGPRGRGRGASRGGVNTPSSRPENRFPPVDSPQATMPDERHPPTGPASGRGRRGPYESGSQSVHSPAVTTPTSGTHMERPRQSNTGAPSPAPPQQSVPPAPVASGVHPDRLAQIVPPPPPPTAQAPVHGHPRASLPPLNTPDRAPINSSQSGGRMPSGNFSNSPAPELSAPTGPSMTNDRGRNRQLNSIQNIIHHSATSENSRGTSIRGRGSRTNLANSDAQVLTGASPVSTPTHERQDPIRPPMNTDRASNGDEFAGRGDHERSRRDRDRSDRPDRQSRRGSRERERSGERERETKEPREYRERRSVTAGHVAGGREERELRRSGREPSGSAREPHSSVPHGAGRESNGSGREPRHREPRGEAGIGGRNEEWGGSNMRGQPRGGLRDGMPRQGDDRREPREDRGRKRRSEDAAGLTEREKRQRR